MKYINPYSIAEFIYFNNLDATTFKKFKKRLLIELELNDDKLVINGRKILKSEIYELIDFIDRNKNSLNIFYSLYKNKELNDFLNGNINLDIKKLKRVLFLEDKQTIQFITPFLIKYLSKIYKEAFLNNKIEILKVEPPLDKKYYEIIFESIYKLLKNKEKELWKLKNTFYDLDDVKSIIGKRKTLNSLPDYFNKIRNDIAYAIRNLSIDSWNENENLDLAMDLMNYALKINVSSNIKEKFLSDQAELIKIKKHREELPIKILKELQIQGIDNLTAEELEQELKNGASFRRFMYCISYIVATETRSSPIFFIKSDESYFSIGLPYALRTLFLGWWGIPWGPIYSIVYLLGFIFGGENMTKDIKKILKEVKL